MILSSLFRMIEHPAVVQDCLGLGQSAPVDSRTERLGHLLTILKAKGDCTQCAMLTVRVEIRFLSSIYASADVRNFYARCASCASRGSQGMG